MKHRILLLVIVMLAALAATPAQALPGSCEFTQTSYWFSSYADVQDNISAELGPTGDDNGLLRARPGGEHVGPWEVFDLICVEAPNIYALRSRANGLYVSAELGWMGDDYGLLRARAAAIGPWEKFKIISLGDLAPTKAEWVSIQSLANGRYVSAEIGWTDDRRGLLRARAPEAGRWEEFGFIPCSFVWEACPD